MGKSPGRWIKTVLFGKKHSKSHLFKNAKPGKQSAAMLPAEDLLGISPVISDPFVVADNGVEDLEPENNNSNAPCYASAVESQSNFVSDPVTDAELTIQNQAATKVQTALRGYLARRSFWALKGIIRLQALIRGHLVRRQAVATFHCMMAIIKFQALVRGSGVRASEIVPDKRKKDNRGGLQDAQWTDVVGNSTLRSGKLATNAYIHKFILSVPTAMPLSLEYDVAEPNSSWNWLERWSISRFWEPPVHPRKASNVKPRKKLGGSQVVGIEAGKARKTTRRASSESYGGDNGALATSNVDKPKRNPKVTIHRTGLVEEHPENELERVKLNLRKVTASAAAAASKKSGMEVEKPELNTKKALDSSVPLVSAQEFSTPAETPTDPDAVDKQPMIEAPLIPITMDESVDTPCENYPPSFENGTTIENPTILLQETCSEEDQSIEVNHKVRKRRSSLTTNQKEFAENMSQNTPPSLPSYMAATESAKAKLRAQGSPKLNEDDQVDDGYVRRHSLPAVTNGKLSSSSPRIHKPIQANGKGTDKINRLVSSRQGDKVVQPGWRR